MDNLYITTSGQGTKPALFFHGLWGGGNYFRTLDFSGLLLGPLYLPDELGFGNSPKPNITYSKQAHIESVKNAIPYGQKYTVIGHSFGTVLAAAFANQYPELVERIICISPILYKDIGEAKKYLQTNLITKLTIDQPRITKMICKTCCSTGLLGVVSPWVVRDKRKHHISGCTQHTWNSYYSSFTEVFLKEPTLPLFEQAARKFPTLIIYGDKDNYLAPATMAAFSTMNLIKRVLPGQTHNVLFNQYAECMKILADWLSNN